MASQAIKRTWDYAQLAKDSLKLRWSRDDKSREAAQKMVAQRLGKMRGLPQKVGQMIAFRANPATAESFSELYESTEPLPWETMRPLLTAAWEIDPEELFREIDPNAKAASLGQVHAATMQDGRKLAIKIQYPGIRDAVMSDLKSLGWLASPFGSLSRDFDLDGYRQTILSGLEEELDYRREAAAQHAFAEGPGRHPWIVVPAVEAELSTENILVSHWVDGDTWEEVQATWSQDEKQELGRRLLFWFVDCLFEYGQLHADLHPGNIRFLRTSDGPKIVLYDFGSIYRMEDTERWALLRLIQATRDQSEAPLPLFVSLGFRFDLLEPMSERLPAMCRLLFEPFQAEFPYDVKQWQLGTRLNDLLADHRMNFRMAGPPKLVYLLRSFQAIIQYLSGLDAKVMWGRAVEPYLARYQPQAARLAVPKLPAQDFSSLARHLKVEVKRDGMVKASIVLGASAIERLETLLDPETLERIEQEKIDLKEIVRNVRRRGYVPGDVFGLVDAQREVKVWLE